ncbi:MAG UNVERIFIED_CONTAM: hypothetical protein LVT10_20335 [Anaerolineae bacterium]
MTRFTKVCESRFEYYFQHKMNKMLTWPNSALRLNSIDVESHQRSLLILVSAFQERIVMMPALMPHIRPQVLDLFSLQNSALGRPYSEIGGWCANLIPVSYPHAKTASFIEVS